MKYYLVAALLLTGLVSTAQEDAPPQMREGAEKFTPEQRASIKTKKLTLALNLSEAQQKEVEKLQLEQARDRAVHREARQANRENREAEQRSSEERYEMISEKMDKRIAFQREMESILTPEQFKKWQAINERHGKNRHRRHGKKSRENHRHRRAH